MTKRTEAITTQQLDAMKLHFLSLDRNQIRIIELQYSKKSTAKYSSVGKQASLLEAYDYKCNSCNLTFLCPIPRPNQKTPILISKTFQRKQHGNNPIKIGKSLERSQIAIDHRIPRDLCSYFIDKGLMDKSQVNHWSNLQLLCNKCNNEKGSSPLWELGLPIEKRERGEMKALKEELKGYFAQDTLIKWFHLRKGKIGLSWRFYRKEICSLMNCEKGEVRLSPSSSYKEVIQEIDRISCKPVAKTASKPVSKPVAKRSVLRSRLFRNRPFLL